MTTTQEDKAIVPVIQADRDAVIAFHNAQLARIMAGDRTLGENRDAIEQAFARHRIAFANQSANTECQPEEVEAMREQAAQVAYRVCAETRHVTLGDKVAAAIRTLPLASSPVPQGWKLVPVEPTEAMRDAGRFSYKDHIGGKRGISRDDAAVIFGAMLKATPTASSPVPAMGEAGKPCTFANCPPGLFLHAGMLCFKSEYSTKPGQPDAYCVDSGEYFWGGTSGDLEKRLALIVTPVATPDTSETATNGEPEITPALLGEVMQDAWGEICDDAGAHPSDMTHGRGTVLFYSPGHWTDLIALRLNERLSRVSPATNGEPDRSGEVECGLSDAQYRSLGYKLTAPLSDWFIRNADRRNPKAAINVSPAYFGEECASLIYGVVRAALSVKDTVEGAE